MWKLILKRESFVIDSMYMCMCFYTMVYMYILPKYQQQLSDGRVNVKPIDILVTNVTAVKYKLKYIYM